MTTPGPDETHKPWIKRVGWLAVLWVIGVATLALVAWLIRIFMNWVGFSA